MTRARHVRSASALLALLVLQAACGGGVRYPITQEAEPLSALNARLRGSAPPVAEAVTFDRLRRARAEPENWLTYYGSYDGWRYSELDQITTENVAELRPAWVFQHALIGLVAAESFYGWEAAPLVVDGVMYVTGPDGWIWALDAATGDLYWAHHYPTPLDVPFCCGNVNRGAAVARGKVFYATGNGHLLALDGSTGELVWERVFLDVRAGESATMAPLVVKDAVIVGSSGAEFGVRGHIDAFHVDTGERLWRRYNVPAPGEPGSETWPQGTDAWAVGGGAAWITGTYDPELDLLYWGTANPGPDFNGDVRPGDNLYTSAMLALDPDTGERVWHYQFTPHDVWDYDGVNEAILFDHDGRELLAHFDKNGYLFVLDRTNGELVHATPFARATWGEIERASGEVTVLRPPSEEGTVACPGAAGAKEWNHAAYSPRTGLLYVPIIEMCATFTKSEPKFALGMPYWGSIMQPIAEDNWGEVAAIEPLTGRKVWTHRTEHPMVGSMLATAGDLVFTGEPTGEFDAFDARTGALLWRFQTGSGIHSNPITYAVDGRQYVAVLSGWGGWLKGYAPELTGASRGGAVFVFALSRPPPPARGVPRTARRAGGSPRW